MEIFFPPDTKNHIKALAESLLSSPIGGARRPLLSQRRGRDVRRRRGVGGSELIIASVAAVQTQARGRDGLARANRFAGEGRRATAQGWRGQRNLGRPATT